MGALKLLEYATGFSLGIDELLFRDYVTSSTPRADGADHRLQFRLVSGWRWFCFVFRKGWDGCIRSPAASRLPRCLRSSAIFTGWPRFTSRAISPRWHCTPPLPFWLSARHLVFDEPLRFHASGDRYRDERNGGAPIRLGRGCFAFSASAGCACRESAPAGIGPEWGVAILAMANAMTFAILVWIGAWFLAGPPSASKRWCRKVFVRRTSILSRRVLRAHLGAGQSQCRPAGANAAACPGRASLPADHGSLPGCHLHSRPAEGRFLQVSRACEVDVGLLGQRNSLGDPTSTWSIPTTGRKPSPSAGSVMSGKPENDFENRYQCRDGSLVPMLWTANWSETHQIMFCVARDMTARKQMESELRTGQRSRRSGQPGQERIPGEHEPRDSHADEWHHRHDRVGARHRARPPSSASISAWRNRPHTRCSA